MISRILAIQKFVSLKSFPLLKSFIPSGLSGHVFRGGALMCTGSVIEQIMRLVRNMVLARLLMPETIGIMSIILAVNAAFESFTDVGIREAVVQYPEAEKKPFLNAVWWFAAVRGTVLFVIGFLITPFISSFYNITEAYQRLLMISFCAILFNGAISTQAYVALKKMCYGRWMAITQGAALGGVFVTLFLVWILRDLRALVYGYVAEAFLKLTLSFIICPFKPELFFEKNQTSELFRFIRGMAGVPFLTFLFIQSDIFFLGKIVDIHNVGLYGMAGTLAASPALLISVVVNPVLIPAFAQIQEQFQRINTALVKITRMLSFAGFPLCALVLLFGSEIMRMVYGPNYVNAGQVLAILFFATFLRTIASPIPAIYIGIGQPAKNRIFTAIRTGIHLLIIYPCAYFWGLRGAAAAGATAMGLAWFFQVRQMKTLTNLEIGNYILSVFTGLVGAVAVTGFCFIVRKTLGAGLLSLCIAGAFCGTVILVGSVMLMRTGSSPGKNVEPVSMSSQEHNSVFFKKNIPDKS